MTVEAVSQRDGTLGCMSQTPVDPQLPDPHGETLFGWPTTLLRQLRALRTRGYDEDLELQQWREQHAALIQQAPPGAAAPDDPALLAARKEAQRRHLNSGASDPDTELLSDLLIALSGPPDDQGIVEHRQQLLQIIADSTHGETVRLLRTAVARNTRWLVDLGLAERSSGLLWSELQQHRYVEDDGGRVERSVAAAAAEAGRDHPLFVHGGLRPPSVYDTGISALRRSTIADVRQFCERRAGVGDEAGAAAKRLAQALDEADTNGLLDEYTRDPAWDGAPH